MVSSVLLTMLVLGGSAAGHIVSPGATPTVTPSAEFVNVSATSNFAFVPDSISVEPGATVHLVVTNDADFSHTFVLPNPSAVNITIPTSDSPTQLYAFLNAHSPLLVNLSLNGTVGATASATFVAPPIGTYEFVCEIPDHFQSGMYGFLHSSTTSPSSSSSSSPLSPVVIGAVVVVVVVVLAVAVLALRRRPKAPMSPP